jgi:hypothetical protein
MMSPNSVVDLEPLRDLVTRLTVSTNALAASRGCIMTSNQTEELLTNAAFSDIQTMPSPPYALISITVGRRS